MMQYDPTKVDLNHPSNTYANQYLPANQSQYRTDNINQSYQPPPPPYSPYPQQPIVSTGYILPGVQYYNQTPLYPQQNVVIVSSYVPFWKKGISTTITTKLRAFLITSGLISLIWSLVTISLEIVIIIEIYWEFYRSILAGSFLLSGSVCMLVAACHRSYPLGSLTKIFACVLFFCIFGLVSSAVSYKTSTKCSSLLSNKYSCDNEVVSASKITILIVFVVASFQTLINILVLNNQHKKTLVSSAASRIPNH